MGLVVEAVIVNHNTSVFAELALRSLVVRHEAENPQVDLRITVSDNHSTDADLDDLARAASQLGAAFELSSWPVGPITNVNSHGDVLREFVLEHPEADMYLLVDADIVFLTDDPVSVMARDLRARAGLWAVQARFETVEEARGPGGSLWDKREGTFDLGVRVAQWGADYEFTTTGRPRCHPGCTLIANSDLFRRVAERIGFSTAVVVSESSGGLFDTFSLASEVMSAAGQSYALSDAIVHHYFGASYDDTSDRPAKRRADVEARLANLR